MKLELLLGEEVEFGISLDVPLRFLKISLKLSKNRVACEANSRPQFELDNLQLSKNRAACEASSKRFCERQQKIPSCLLPSQQLIDDRSGDDIYKVFDRHIGRLSAAESIDVDKEDLKCEDNLEEATRNPMLMIVAFQATEV